MPIDQRSPVQVTFEVAQPPDAEELVAIRIAAMRESLEKIGRFSPERARERLLTNLSFAETRFISWEVKRVGFYTFLRRGQEFRLEHLYVLPSAQRSGLGSGVMQILISEAEEHGTPIRLSALRGSLSNEFYLRHGFELEGESEWDLNYVRHPRGRAASCSRTCELV